MNKKHFLGGEEESQEKGKYHFHYNREERLKSLSPEIRDRAYKPRGIFKRNKSLIFILIDIGVILFFLFGFSIFGTIMSSRKIQEGISFQLKAFEYNEKIYVSLKIKTRQNLDPQGSNIITVNFYCGKDNADESIEIVDLIPQKKGGERIIRAVFEDFDTQKTAFADIDFLERARTLKTDIKPE